MRFFGRLYDWHRRFGAKITLYVFAGCEQFRIDEIPARYSEELGAASDWLRFGYHSNSDIPFIEETEYQAGFKLVKNTLASLGAGQINTLRLHCWQASPEQKEWLAANGVGCLFYPDDEKLYPNGETFAGCGLLHRRTRVRFEYLKEVNPESLLLGRDYVAAFTHEWCFDENIPKIEQALRLYRDAGYEFIHCG